MLFTMIMMCFAQIRGVKVGRFYLREAIESGRPVILWHSPNQIDYNGYRLELTDVIDSRVVIGSGRYKVPGRKRYNEMRTNITMFIEYDGLINDAVTLVEDGTFFYLGEGELNRYRLDFSFTEKPIPDD